MLRGSGSAWMTIFPATIPLRDFSCACSGLIPMFLRSPFGQREPITANVIITPTSGFSSGEVISQMHFASGPIACLNAMDTLIRWVML
jgi:hypothetical protein